MSKVIVRGGLPGLIRVELEGSDIAVDVDSGLTAYQAFHELQPFMQVLADLVPVIEPVAPPVRKSKAPPAGDA